MIDRFVVGDLATNCWIYAPPSGETVLIDPGAEGQTIISRLAALNLTPRYILLTHGHFDHCAALADVAAAYPEAVIAIHAADGHYLGPAALDAHRQSFTAVTGDSRYIDALWKPLPPPARLLAEGEAIGPFTVLHLPGHSPGSAAYYNAAEGILFDGDTLFANGVGRTDLPGGSDRQLAASLRRLLALPPGTRVYPGHGWDTSIGACL